MNAVEVKRRFCALARKVMSEHFEGQLCADCFCGENGAHPDKDPYYQFEEPIMAFIEEAVAEKLSATPKKPGCDPFCGEASEECEMKRGG